MMDEDRVYVVENSGILELSIYYSPTEGSRFCIYGLGTKFKDREAKLRKIQVALRSLEKRIGDRSLVAHDGKTLTEYKEELEYV